MIRLLAALPVAGLLLAQGALPSGTASADDDGRVVISVGITKEVEVEDFLVALGRVLDINLVFDPSSRGIRARKLDQGMHLKMARRNLLSLARALLVRHGLVFKELKSSGRSTYAVLYVRDLRRMFAPVPRVVRLTSKNLEQYTHMDGVLITSVLRTRPVSVSDLAALRTAVARTLTASGTVAEVPELPALVVTDFAPYVAGGFRMLRSLEPPAGTATGER